MAGVCRRPLTLARVLRVSAGTFFAGASSGTCFPGTASGTRPSVWTDARGYTHFDRRGPYWTPQRIQSTGRLALLGFAAGTVALLASQETIPFVGRSHAILLPVTWETALGQRLVHQTVAEARAQGTLLPAHHPYTQLVRRIGERLEKVIREQPGGGSQAHLRDMAWEYHVIASPEANAMVMPGGKVVVYSGLIELVTTLHLTTSSPDPTHHTR